MWPELAYYFVETFSQYPSGHRRMEIVNRKQIGTGMERVGKIFQNQLNKQDKGHRERIEKVAHHTTNMAGM